LQRLAACQARVVDAAKDDALAQFSYNSKTMNDDDPRQVVELLKAEHRRLDEEIAALRENGAIDQLEIARLKKRKLLLKDEIQVLTDRIIPDIIA
jgi:hypothetical protein